MVEQFGPTPGMAGNELHGRQAGGGFKRLGRIELRPTLAVGGRRDGFVAKAADAARYGEADPLDAAALDRIKLVEHRADNRGSIADDGGRIWGTVVRNGRGQSGC